jgi:hypothetical protein
MLTFVALDIQMGVSGRHRSSERYQWSPVINPCVFYKSLSNLYLEFKMAACRERKTQRHNPKFKAAGSFFVFCFKSSLFIFRSPFYVASIYDADVHDPCENDTPTTRDFLR